MLLARLQLSAPVVMLRACISPLYTVEQLADNDSSLVLTTNKMKYPEAYILWCPFHQAELKGTAAMPTMTIGITHDFYFGSVYL